MTSLEKPRMAAGVELRRAARCGTSSGYVTHYKRGEKPCHACRRARYDYYATKRRVQDPEPYPPYDD